MCVETEPAGPQLGVLCGSWVARDARLARAPTAYLLVTRGPGWGTYGTVDMVAAGCCAWGACSVVVHHVVHGRCAGRRTGHRPGARIRRARRRRAYVCVRSIVYEVWRVRARRGRKKTRAGDDSTRTVTKSDTTANEDSVATTQACAMRLPTVHTTLAYFYVSLGVRLWTDATRLPQLVSSDVSALTVPRRVRARRRLGGLRRHPRGM